MKKSAGKKTPLLVLLALVFVVPSVHAQTHSVSLMWGASPDAAANPVLPYAVSTVEPGTDCYNVRAYLNGAESASSSLVVAAILSLLPDLLVVTAAK